MVTSWPSSVVTVLVGASMKVASLAEVLAFENCDVVDRFAEKNQTDFETAKDVFHETLKLLWLMEEQKREEPLGLQTVPSQILVFRQMAIMDEMWHTFILFTKEYSAFCEKYFGHYIHHLPTTSKERKKDQSLRSADPVAFEQKEKGSLEDQVLQLITEVEEQRRQLKEVEKSVQAYEASVKEDKKNLETELAKLEQLLKEQIQRRDSVCSQLSPDTASLYTRLASKGTAVATAENGMCLGCNIKIRPQLYNEVLGFKAIHRCPSCGKILIVPPPRKLGAKSVCRRSSSIRALFCRVSNSLALSKWCARVVAIRHRSSFFFSSRLARLGSLSEIAITHWY